MEELRLLLKTSESCGRHNNASSARGDNTFDENEWADKSAAAAAASESVGGGRPSKHDRHAPESNDHIRMVLSKLVVTSVSLPRENATHVSLSECPLSANLGDILTVSVAIGGGDASKDSARLRK